MRRITAGLVLVVVAVVAAAPAAQGASRPGTPSKRAVLRALDGVVKATPWAAGKRQGRAARRAFSRGRACDADKALATLGKAVQRRQRAAAKLRRRSTATAMRRLGARTARARALVLRTRPARRACGGAPLVAVDTALKPARAALPALGGSGARPVARVQDAYGNGADFVADELLVTAPSEDALKPFLARWKGKVLQTIDLRRIGGDRLQFLVRVRASAADTALLADDAAKLSRTRGGVETVSSDAGLGTLAAAAREARRGVQVGVNWVSQGSAVAAGTAFEAGNGPPGWSLATPDWSRDAFTWRHLAAGGPQDVGVAPAWQLLERAGRTANKVGLAVLDMGFAPETNGELGGVTAISNVPSVAALGTANLLGCSGGGGCPWHGTNVANTAFAPVDNGFGVAGTGGPVARPIVVFTLYDYFTSIAAIVEAGAAGARIVNMSYGADVPAAFAWTALPFEATTGIARAAGMLIFAAAGNRNTDVDATDCFIVCWEETLHTPCENAGVLCVGALGDGSLMRASYSNYGTGGGVALFAPGTVLVGLDPQTVVREGDSGVHAVNGTSFASPYLAGVAALVMAADPTMSTDDVQRALFAASRISPDPQVGRYVNALDAVRRALPRVLRIEQPADGQEFRRGIGIGLSAFVYEDDLGPADVTWTLADGTVVGRGATASTGVLPYGPLELTATARFPDGAELRDTRRITMTNDPPRVELQAPAGGSTFFQGETITLTGSSADVNQPPGFRLADGQVTWLLDGTQRATGPNATLDLTGVSPGSHTITLRGTDDLGVRAEASVAITVQPPPPNPPPSVSIASPANNTTYADLQQEPGGEHRWYRDVPFDITAGDPNGDPLTYTWTEKHGTRDPVVRSTQAEPTIRLFFADCFNDVHDMTVAVSDGTTTRTATVRVRLDLPC